MSALERYAVAQRRRYRAQRSVFAVVLVAALMAIGFGFLFSGCSSTGYIPSGVADDIGVLCSTTKILAGNYRQVLTGGAFPKPVDHDVELSKAADDLADATRAWVEAHRGQ